MLELKSFRKMHIVAGGAEEIGPPFASPAKNKVFWRVVAVLAAVIGVILLTVALTHHHNTSNTTTKHYHSEVTDRDSLVGAVNMWVENPAKAKREYGDISEWDTSKVTDMHSLFSKMKTFNGDISKWDVSKVTSMNNMFHGASAFNQDLSKWDVTKVTNAVHMFHDASSFNQDVGTWAKAKDSKFTFTNVGVGKAHEMFMGALNMRYPIEDGENSEMKTLLPAAGDADHATLCKGVPALSKNCGECDANAANKKKTGSHGFAQKENEEVCTCKWPAEKSGEAAKKGGQHHIHDLFVVDTDTGKCVWELKPDGHNVRLRQQVNIEADATKAGKEWGGKADKAHPLADYKVGEITDMSFLFCADESEYGEVDKTTAKCHTKNAYFDADISKWDVSEVEDMRYMFDGAKAFNRDISKWAVRDDVRLTGAFEGMDAMAYPLDGDHWTKRLNKEPKNTYCKGVPRLSDNCMACDGTKNFEEDTKAGSATFGQCICKDGYKEYKNALGTAAATDATKFQLGCVVQPPGINELFGALRDWNIEATPEHKAKMKVQYGNIEFWDTSKVTNMDYLLICKPPKATDDCTALAKRAARFNEDISKWTVSQVTTMQGAFMGAEAFDNGGQPLPWDTKNVADMSSMFKNAKSFNQDVSSWEVSKVTTMAHMFEMDDIHTTGAKQGQQKESISKFNNKGKALAWKSTPKLLSTSHMFANNAAFDVSLTDFTTDTVTDFSSMFLSAIKFNKPVPTNVGAAVTLHGMFQNAQAFNEDLSKWKLQKAQNVEAMFYGAKAFTGKGPQSKSNIGNWFTTGAAVSNMKSMFQGAVVFNSDGLNGWDVSRVTDMTSMFEGAETFNQNLDNWGTITNVKYANRMFYNAKAMTYVVDLDESDNYEDAKDFCGGATNVVYKKDECTGEEPTEMICDASVGYVEELKKAEGTTPSSAQCVCHTKNVKIKIDDADTQGGWTVKGGCKCLQSDGSTTAEVTIVKDKQGHAYGICNPAKKAS